MFALRLQKIKPAKYEQFMVAYNQVLVILKKEELTPIPFYAAVSNFTLLQSAPIQSFADLDKITATMQQQDKLIGAELMGQMNEAVEQIETSIVLYRSDLSYLPPPDSMMNDQRYTRWTTYYFAPNDFPKVIEMAKKYKAFYQRKGVEAYYEIYQPIFGGELNKMIMVERAKNPTVLATRNAKEQKTTKGAANDVLERELMTLLTDIQIVHGWARNDLSIPPK